jgi:hypothetical protein
MKKRSISYCFVALLALSILTLPVSGAAQQQQPSGGGSGVVFVLGSVLYSIVHVPLKLATCVGTQAIASATYPATFDVPGGYEGGTNGRDIGETARLSCTGKWWITPSQVKSDFGS